MKKIIFLIILFIIFSCISGYNKFSSEVLEEKEVNYVPYYLKVYEADSLYIIGKYEKSQKILDSLFKKFEPLNQETYSEYITYLRNKVLLNDFQGIDLVLKKAIQDYGFKVDYCKKDSIVNIAFKKSSFNEEDLIGFYEIYVRGLNLNYRHALESMIEEDQRVRIEGDSEEWEKIDTKNAKELKILIKKHGYPSVKKIGRFNLNNKNSNVKILFLHATKDAREDYILDLMLESIKKGDCQPIDFATVYDKYLLSSGESNGKVLYGELIDRNLDLDMVVLYPQKIDSIRKSIGLEKLGYRRWKLKKMLGVGE